jgi:hypothetical protein
MSKSLARVLEMAVETRTAGQAAATAGCVLGWIAESPPFPGGLGRLYLFLTAGGNRFDAGKAAAGTPSHIFPAAPEDLMRVTGARVADFIA